MASFFYQLLALLAAAGLAWLLYKSIKQKPELYSKANLSKSLHTLGFLALLLIGITALLVLLLRQ